MPTNDSVLVMKLFTRTRFTFRMSVQTLQENLQYTPHISLYWESTWDVEKNSITTSVIAVQGQMYRLKMFSNNMDFKNTAQIIYYWIFKRNVFYSISTKIKQYLPKVVLKKKAEKGTYLFVTYCRYRDVTVETKGCEPQIWSWKQALNMCRNAGGELPQFLSRKEQEELISIIKTSTDYFFIEAVFIHLKIESG